MVPNATSLALLINPTSPNLAAVQTKDLQAAARSRGLQLHVLQASNNRDFDDVFSSVSRLPACASPFVAHACAASVKPCPT